VILVLALFLLLVPASWARAQGEVPPSVDLSVPHAPIPMRADGKTHLVYELHVTNLGTDAITLNRVEVLTEEGALLARYDTGELDTVIFRPGLPAPPPARAPGVFPIQGGARIIAGGMRAVVYVWVAVESGAVPGSLRHRAAIEAAGPGGAKRTGVVDWVRADVHRQATPSLDPPFREGTWLAANGPSNASLHRRTILAVNGRARIAQRFAIDWIKLGDNGLPYRGDPAQNASWFGYGEDVLAAADGVVTAVKDKIVDNVPLSTPSVPITLETVAGNHVIVEHGRGRFALYAHLQPGSLRVKLGDRVRRGQVLGRLGNSGNSDAPHMHFHLCDANSPLGCEGLPYVMERFELLGKLELGDDLGKARPWTPKVAQPADVRTKELPLEDQVVRFSPPPSRQ
jgi:hypothetical protein